MSQTQEQTIDLNAILQEVGGEIDELIKSEQSRLEELKKKEDSMKAMKAKEESSKESMQKDEGSGFESPAPEASSPEAPPESPEASSPEDQQDSLESMVQGLDDDMLHELMQCVQMEMESRSKAASPAPENPQSMSASPAAPAMKNQDHMYKKELESFKEKLAKSEEQSKNLEKAMATMTELMEKMVSRPVSKAVTDIRNVQFVDKGEGELKKSETYVSDAEFHKRAKKIASSQQELGKLTKSEREALSCYFVTKQRSPELTKLVLQ